MSSSFRMQLGFSLVAFFLFAYTLLKLVKKFKTNHRTSNLPPPGPWKLPVIGNLHQLVGSLPHHKLRGLAKKYGPLMLLQLGQVPTIVVSSQQVAKEVMRTHDVIFASRPHVQTAQILSYNYSGLVFSPNGESWKRLRKICVSELLSTKRVLSFRSKREEEVTNLINWISSKGGSAINFTEKVYSLMYCITSRAALGKKSSEQEAFVSFVEEIINVVAGFNIFDMFPSIRLLQQITGVWSHAEMLHQESDRIVESIINDHKKQKITGKSDEDQDLVDVLLRTQENGNLEFPFTTDHIKAVIVDIFAAGSETSATTVDWAMCEMMKNPRVMKKAQAEVREVFHRTGKVNETSIDEMKYMKLVVQETLRFHPAAPLLIPRECGERCQINGFDVPVKAKVIINAWAIGRDPKCWTEPESFIPERFLNHSVDYRGTNFEYIPFGAGRRICPGISFGLASVELALAMLLYHFDWKLPNGMKHGDLDMTEAFGVTVRRKKDLWMIPTPYQLSSVA